jgi:hypothetical protein
LAPSRNKKKLWNKSKKRLAPSRNKKKLWNKRRKRLAPSRNQKSFGTRARPGCLQVGTKKALEQEQENKIL